MCVYLCRQFSSSLSGSVPPIVQSADSMHHPMVTFNDLLGHTIPHDPSHAPSSQHTWRECRSDVFHLRTGGYADTGKKSPSAPSIMQIVAVEIVRCQSRVDDIAAKVQLHPEWTAVETHHPLIPPVFVVNVQIPEDFSTSFFTTVDNGPGWSLVFIFKMTEHTSAVIGDLLSGGDGMSVGQEECRANVPAIRLFVRYCMESVSGPGDSSAAKNDPFRGRFKVVLYCSNLEEFGLPSFITSYNAKPVLIRNTGTYIRGSCYAEMDINVHKFGSMPKKALETLISRFESMMIDVGFCIESREDSEMPETLIGAASLNRPVPQLAPMLVSGRE